MPKNTDKNKVAKTKDPRDIVTPDAFQVCPKLLNRPLASPYRRGGALLIDLCVVAMLAEISGIFLVLAVAVLFLVKKLGFKLKSALQTLVYVGLSISLVFAALSFFAFVLTTDDNGGVCVSNCDAKLAMEISQKVFSDDFDQSAFKQRLMTTYEFSEEQADSTIADLLGGKGPIASPEKTDEHDELESDEPLTENTKDNVNINFGGDPSENSLVGWTEGLLKDLGLGFGWAAAYFTLFTSWFRGQTLGKKALKIRVIHLDNSPISLWDAFGRYGGYGAGIATGLLGFLQIFWDANRQAIHDKISATVVVDLRDKARWKAKLRAQQRSEQSAATVMD